MTFNDGLQLGAVLQREKLFEFLVGHTRWVCELVDLGPWGVLRTGRLIAADVHLLTPTLHMLDTARKQPLEIAAGAPSATRRLSEGCPCPPRVPELELGDQV